MERSTVPSTPTDMPAGDELEPPRSQQFTRSQVLRIRTYASRHGMPFSTAVRQLVNAGLDQQQRANG